MDEVLDALIEKDDLGTLTLAGRDVLSIGLLTESYDQLIANGLVQPPEWVTDAINDLIGKVDAVVFESEGIHLWDPEWTPA